ncbi:MAG: hypothetical protein HN458_06740 [Euryarchaeota archaeon]|jgi:hypothetical protein|nr:hypothetical protein [Euryarchaeota archaeon]
MANQSTNVGEFATSEHQGSLYGSRLIPKIVQKPIGVGSFVGLLVGIANTIILSIPLLYSAPAGVLLGVAVCIVACPGMRNELAEHKATKTEYRQKLMARSGRKNAFTMYD